MDHFTFKPLTPQTWKPFETLFGPRGACGGCWCMTWRLSKADFEKSKGEGNRKKMHSLVANGENIGVLAMNRDVPVGWCAVAPRGKYIRLQKSRALKPTDDKPVWAVSCFFYCERLPEERCIGSLARSRARLRALTRR